MRSAQEVIDIFNTKYTNINAGFSPGINLYEMSLYLTEAQKQIIDDYFKGTPVKDESFEDTERVRKNISKLSLHAETNVSLSSTPSSDDFKCYTAVLKPDVWRVVWENALLSDSNLCGTSKKVISKPVTHDELDTTLDNPFKRPSDQKVLRLDIGGAHEIISRYSVTKYIYRYLKYPTPFIIANLNDYYDELGYTPTVEGISTISLCEFDNFVEDIIISRAVELATVDYKENSLQTQLPINSRVE